MFFHIVSCLEVACEAGLNMSLIHKENSTDHFGYSGEMHILANLLSRERLVFTFNYILQCGHNQLSLDHTGATECRVCFTVFKLSEPSGNTLP